MENQATQGSVCPQCHSEVRPTDYYCCNCGKNLHEPPPPTDLGHQLLIWIVSLFFPPFGIVYAIRYFKFPNASHRIIALTATILTIVSCVLVTVWTIRFIHTVDESVGKQLQQFQGL